MISMNVAEMNSTKYVTMATYLRFDSSRRIDDNGPLSLQGLVEPSMVQTIMSQRFVYRFHSLYFMDFCF